MSFFDSVNIAKESSSDNCVTKFENIRVSPLYYLNYELRQKKKNIQDKETSRFIENITKAFDLKYRYVLYIILKHFIVTNEYNKQVILKKISVIHDENEIENLINVNPLNKVQLQKFMNLDKLERKGVIDKLIEQLEKIDFSDFFVIEELSELDVDLIDSIEKGRFSYIEYNYNLNNRRMIYLFDNGMVIAIDDTNNSYLSSILYFKKSKINYIEKIISGQLEHLAVDSDTRVVSMSNKTIHTDVGFFYLVLLLLGEKKLNDKVIFNYRINISEKFRSDIYNFKKSGIFLFTNWFPRENDIDKVVKQCERIAPKLGIDFHKLSIVDLKFFKDYYYQVSDEDNALKINQQLVERGIDFISAKKRILEIYKELTKKKCYKLKVSEEASDRIFDSKINGVPYLPIGEAYPTDSLGNPLNLLIQINFEDIRLENFPSKGILEVFMNNCDLRNSSYEIRYYEDISLNYQTKFPQFCSDSHCFLGIDGCRKIKFVEHDTWMPVLNKNFDSFFSKAVRLYNREVGVSLYNLSNESDSDMLFNLIYDEEPYPLLLGGYSNYCKFSTGDGSECEKRNKVSLLSLVSDDTSQCLNVVISKEDLINKNFDKAELFYMD